MHYLLRLHRIIPLLVAAFVLPIAETLAAAEAAQYDFDLAEGPAETTLRQFAQQAGGQFVFSTSKVAGVRTQATKGRMSARNALENMIAGTPLRLVQDEKTGALTVDRAAEAYGSIEGRVFDTVGGSYLNNARVSIEALRLEAFTDQYGYYQLTRVPAGRVLVRAFYTGLQAATATVSVTAGERAQHDFNLQAVKMSGDTPIQLDVFTVAASRDMAASDVAVNEQRFSANIKNVVSTDSFGDIAEGNVGEFVKFLPGVTLERDGSDGRSISLGGVPVDSTPISVDGNALASAASSSGNRTVELEQISINNASRIEISRSQNADSPASAIGGSVNLISKSAFERVKPVYQFKVYGSVREGDLTVHRQPGPFDGKSFPIQPNVEFSAIVPVNKRFGFTISALETRTLANGNNIGMDWVPNGLTPSTSFPATTPDNPYLGRYRIADRPKLSIRDSLGITADYRVTKAGVLTLGFQYSFFHAEWWGRTLTFDAGRVASFGPSFTQGATGAGTVSLVYDCRDKAGTTYMPTFRYRHTGPTWKIETGGALSHASNYYRDIDKGYWQASNAYLRNATIRFDNPSGVRPEKVTVTNAAGQPLDWTNLANFNLESGSANQYQGEDQIFSLYGNARRELNLVVPVAIKTGIDFRVQERDVKRPVYSWNYYGADGVIRTADDNAAQWFDPIFSKHGLPLGFPHVQWMNPAAIGATAREHPDYFRHSESQAVTYYRGLVNTSQAITETIIAPYFRTDTRLLGDRLLVTAGLRYEETKDDGLGGLIDPSRTYQKDDAGNIVRDAAGKPIVIAPLSSLAGTKLAYIERGSRVVRSYDGLYPSANLSYNFRTNLIGRASYAKSISRPGFGNIMPSASIPDPTSTSRLISITNPDLKPWTADSYGVSLEYYFNEPSSGLVSVRGYQRNIENFWSLQTVSPTNELLEAYGLSPEVYGASQGYLVSTRVNTSDSVLVRGLELDYRQNLTFLPAWARGFTVFANTTMQRLSGSASADFSGFITRTTNFGVSYSRSRLTARINWNLRGLQKRSEVTTAGVEPGTYNYTLPKHTADMTIEYRLTRKLSFFAAGRNIFAATDDAAIYGPSTPEYAKYDTRGDYRGYWTFGIKGTF